MPTRARWAKSSCMENGALEIIHPHPPGTAFNQPQLTILRLGFLSFPFLRKAENPDLCMKSYRLQMLVTNSIFYNYELATICL